MKRVCWMLAVLGCVGPLTGQAQDARTEERLRQLRGQVEDLAAGQEAQRKRIEQLAREIDRLRQRQSAPVPNYASNDDLRRLKTAIEDLDRKRMGDYEKIRTELLKLGKSLAAPLPAEKRTAGVDPREPSGPMPVAHHADGRAYTVRKGDTLPKILSACKRRFHIEVTREQIRRANPDVNIDKLRPGMKLVIPRDRSRSSPK